MRQVVQFLKNGMTNVIELPVPRIRDGHLLVETSRTLVSPGTERILVDFGRAGWLEKARQQPERVREILQKAKTDGISATVDAVRFKLDEPLALGYSNVGGAHQLITDVNGAAAHAGRDAAGAIDDVARGPNENQVPGR